MRKGAPLLRFSIVLFLAACNGPDGDNDPMNGDEASRPANPAPGAGTATAPAGLRGTATIEGRSGSNLYGEATLEPRGGETVVLDLRIQNAPPGQHAVHLHENGDCSAPDASSAGAHWNPTNENHGKRPEKPYHAGDINNIEVGADGNGTLTMTADDWSLEPAGQNSVIGKAVVVHAGPDDFKTQPDGNGGARIGCGVIQSGARPTSQSPQ